MLSFCIYYWGEPDVMVNAFQCQRAYDHHSNLLASDLLCTTLLHTCTDIMLLLLLRICVVKNTTRKHTYYKE